MTSTASLETGALRVLGRELADRELAMISKYLVLLEKWQKIHRLIGSTQYEWMVIHVLLDSWLYLRLLPQPARQTSVGKDEVEILDFGSGAGVPGVPLAIVLPRVKFTLLESRERRVSFLSEVVRELGLGNCTVFHGRAETASRLYGRYDAVVVRCAGDAADVVPQALRFARPDGSVILSGPPKPRPTQLGEWIDVEIHAASVQRRHFLVVKRGEE